MRNELILSLSVFSLLALSSCSKLGPLSADNFNVDPNPLEAQGGQVPAVINGTFPSNYMKTKAVVTVTPELRYGNGQVAKGQSATFQGEKVMGNDQTISYKMGGRYSMKTSFDYVPEMQKSDMYLTFDARLGKKKMNVPAVKVATGVLATAELYKQTLMNAGGCIAPDSFQRVKAQKTEANIKFLVNQANLRKSELKNNSVKEFVSMLKKINADREGLNLKNVEVLAYASPEGGFAFNDKLANKRQGTRDLCQAAAAGRQARRVGHRRTLHGTRLGRFQAPGAGQQHPGQECHPACAGDVQGPRGARASDPQHERGLPRAGRRYPAGVAPQPSHHQLRDGGPL
jgi:hypothetical protein